jgi:hypothetical protein
MGYIEYNNKQYGNARPIIPELPESNLVIGSHTYSPSPPPPLQTWRSLILCRFPHSLPSRCLYIKIYIYPFLPLSSFYLNISAFLYLTAYLCHCLSLLLHFSTIVYLCIYLFPFVFSIHLSLTRSDIFMFLLVSLHIFLSNNFFL